MYDTAVNTLQDDIEVGTDEITGTLLFKEGGLSPAGPLAGDGYFLTLKVDDVPAGTKSIKVGLVPSEGTGMVEMLGDPDMNCVGKIADKNTQKFRIEVTDANDVVSVKEWGLTNLEYAQPFNLNIEPADGDFKTYGNTFVASLQKNIEVHEDNIVGMLIFKEGGLSQAGPLAGDGVFLTLKVDPTSIPEGTKSIKVGLVPSEGTGLVELINDPDLAVTVKITDGHTQKFRVEVTYADDTTASKEWGFDRLWVADALNESDVDYQATDSSQSIGPDQTVADAQADITFDKQAGALTGTIYKLSNAYRMFIDGKIIGDKAVILTAGFYNTETEQFINSSEVQGKYGRFQSFEALYIDAVAKPKCVFRMTLLYMSGLTAYKDYDISGLVLLDE